MPLERTSDCGNRRVLSTNILELGLELRESHVGCPFNTITEKLDLHRCEVAWSTRVEGLLGNLAGAAMSASQSLDGPYADTRVLVNIRVRDTLEGHRKGHLLELVRDVAANHGGDVEETWLEETDESNGSCLNGITTP